MPIKIFDYLQKSEDGFVLIAAIMAVMIMLAVSFLILTTTTQDIRISSRLVGERKALSAAESGAYIVYTNALTLNDMISNTISDTQVDPTNDPYTYYSVAQTVKTNMQAFLKGGCPGCLAFIYNTDVTGKDTKYVSSVTISIGMAPPPAPGGPIYENPIAQ